MFRFGLLVSLICAFPSWGRVLITREGNFTHYDLSIDGISFDDVTIEGKPFVKAKLAGLEGHEGIIHQPGHPEISVARWILAGDGEVKVTADSQSDYTPGRHIYWKPALHPVPRSTHASASLVFSLEAYQRDELTPESDYSVKDLGRARGMKLRLVTLHPLRYRPASGQYSLKRHFRVTLEEKTHSSPKPLPAQFAFVVGPKFAASPSLARYRSHKEALGFAVHTRFVGPKSASPDTIRQELRRLYTTTSGALRHVLLVGDVDEIPGYVSPRLNEEGSVTDHYYRSLDTDDYESDIATPDVSLGRLSVETEMELSVVVDKQIRYETGRFKDRSWLSRASLIGTDDSYPEHYQMAEATHNYAIEKWLSPAGFLGNFPGHLERGGDRLYAITHEATTADVLQRLKEGRGIVNYGGHGSPESWAGPSLSIDEVKSLKSSEATPFVASHACYTGRFVVDSFGEAWLRHAQGSILFWGSMEPLYWHAADDLIGRAMYDAPFDKNYTMFDDLMTYAIREAWRYLGGEAHAKYLWETYVVLGDPSLHWIVR